MTFIYYHCYMTLSCQLLSVSLDAIHPFSSFWIAHTHFKIKCSLLGINFPPHFFKNCSNNDISCSIHEDYFILFYLKKYKLLFEK